MSLHHLIVVLWDQVVGHVRSGADGRLTFEYDSTWRTSGAEGPLSLSMPLSASRHAHGKIEPFLWNLLPDDQRVLDRWGKRFHVSPRNPFALLANVGEDCPGAVQLIRPERLDAVLRQAAPEIEWLEEAEVEHRLSTLRRDRPAWLPASDAGYFSLAGAQAKIALAFDDVKGRWGLPSGRTPTTHILKPPHESYDGMVENEHLCLSLARRVGLAVTTSAVQRFGDEVALVLERYDRARTAHLAAAAAAEAAASATDPNPIRAAQRASSAAARAAALNELARVQPVLRLHQEDLCQALGVSPMSKYQNDGGPSPVQIVHLLREHSSRSEEDVGAFVDALAFNWIVAGTDGHAKNYALLLAGQRVRLAPLYDIASALPYPELDPHRLKLAMKIGDQYRLRQIGRREWEKLAETISLDLSSTVERVRALAEAVTAEAEPLALEEKGQGLDDEFLDRLAAALVARGTSCLARL